MISEYRYPAFLLSQTDSSKPLVFFAAPATEIDRWTGVPQRRRLEGEETVGWQREENPGRLKELTSFFTDRRNVVQNPLLCALQDSLSVTFEPGELDPSFGHIVLQIRDFSELTLMELLQMVRDSIAMRVPSLTNIQVDDFRLRSALERARESHDIEFEQDQETEEIDEIEENETESVDEDDSVGDVASVVFAEETQLLDFYQEVLIRINILERMSAQQPDELLGYSRDAMLSYLKPIVLVDGQHRLRGAVLAAESRLDSDEGRSAQIEAIDAGSSPDEARQALLATYVRQLPVSLLLDDSPAEHVFQFVVVNQKATPMGRALLGTIVSTSLSRDELLPVAERLRDAGIPLDDSQAVAYMTRASESPFFGLVQTGVSGDNNGHLQWTVLKGLTAIFRELRGGRLYGQNNDYAAIWREKFLQESSLVSNAENQAEMLHIWAAPDGPWRPVFIRFFQLVRDRFGSDDLEAPNAWGVTSSNLFNKISLTILVADYFQFLVEQRQTLSSLADVDETVNDWLQDTNSAYFNRDWKMGNLKKDQGAVKDCWATVWYEYRKNPSRLPRIEKYRP